MLDQDRTLAASFSPSQKDAPPSPPAVTIAATATWREVPRRLEWLAKNRFACAYTPHPDHLDRIAATLAPFIARGMAVRHHGYFPGHEIGHADPRLAEQAMALHLRAMVAIRAVGQPVMTVHVGLNPEIPLDHGRAVENLGRLHRLGQGLGVQVSLENLRRGPTSNPQTLLKWAAGAGSAITLDVGHAVSSRCVAQKDISVPEIVGMVAHRLLEVHLYESETDRHWPPKSMQVLGPIVDRLVTTDCRWWTIELEASQDVLNTRSLVAKHFGTSIDPHLRLPATPLEDVHTALQG